MKICNKSMDRCYTVVGNAPMMHYVRVQQEDKRQSGLTQAK